MAIHSYECPAGHQFDRVLALADYAQPQTCDCGKPAQKVFLKAPIGYVQGACVYDSPIDGRPITSWAQRRDDMARHGCQEYDPMMRQDADRFRKRADEQLEKAMDATVEETIEKMPSRKKELLERELSAGASAEIVRSTI